jgi:NADPH:quinone reductase-like Zn-dependent oxidoreductase
MENMEKVNSEAIYLIRKGEAKKAFEQRSFQIHSPEEGEVMIEVEAFGLNFADVMARKGLYREAPPMPCVVGYEVVGKIMMTGKGVSEELLGKRVVAFCRFGGYARHVLTPAHAVAEINTAPAEDAMALCTQAVTAYYMANYLTPVRKGERVLIHAAAGGVGTILIQLVKLQGGIVYAKVGDRSKEDLVRSLGADFVLNYNTSDYKLQLQKLLNQDRLDVSFNPSGGSTFKKDMALIGSGGRLILFGGAELTSGKWGILSQLNFIRKMGTIIPVGLMMRSKNILGVNMLKIADHKPEVLTTCMREVVELYRSGKLIPQKGPSFKADEIASAHTALESGKSTGKITVFWK